MSTDRCATLMMNSRDPDHAYGAIGGGRARNQSERGDIILETAANDERKLNAENGIVAERQGFAKGAGRL